MSSKRTKKNSPKKTAPSYPFSFEKPEESIGFLLYQVSMLWQRRVNAALAELALTHAQFAVLAATGWLNIEQDAVTQTDIAKYANLDKMMVSGLLKNLQEKQLIHRAEHETDTRAKVVILTPEGQHMLRSALRLVEASDSALLAPLEEQREVFAKCLKTLLRD